MWLIPRRRADMAPGETRRLKSACAGLRMGEPPLVAEFERRVAAFTGVPQAAAVNSGRLGMRLILEYLGVGDGAEVIIPAYTLKDLIPIVRNSGAEAVPADIDPRTLNVTAASVERRITARTRAIIVLHAFGAPAPVDEITELADRRGIPVIEDCAHSLGATLHGRQTGSFGYAGFFSFEPTKPVNTYGGGMVVSRDPDLVRFIRARESEKPLDTATLLRKAAATRKERLLMSTGLALPVLMAMSSPAVAGLVGRAYRGAQGVPSVTARYSPAQAGLGIAKLATLPERLARRRVRARLLESLLDPRIRVQQLIPGAEPTWYFFIVLPPRRACEMRPRLIWRHGVDAAMESEIADECARITGYADCPNVVEAYFHALALPFFDGLTGRQARRVARAVNRTLDA